uniref:MFS domain-containing protein n=1 Tax=Syphacia muris TaxID=451379 RepID=A0A0N5A7P9_9BILA
MFFEYCLCGLSVLCAILYFYTRTKVGGSEDAQFNSFQRSYLIVYLLAAAGDWLQGPHVYALYDNYGMSKHKIELLFVAGFGSSLVFGTVVGSVADKYGRKTNCFFYGVFYIGSCITKHFGNFWILMIGRLLGGIATSILFSAFESWLVYEHNKRGFEEPLLATIFSHATLGNSLVAIISGIVAQQAANIFGYVAPFDVSLSVLVVMIVILIFTWPENYGDTKANLVQHFSDAVRDAKNDAKVVCLGIIQSLFEGSMYVFVLEWTPALSNANTSAIPHGYIFASFMIACMMGSSIFRTLSNSYRPESFMKYVLLLSSCCLAVPAIVPTSEVLIFSGFVIFEICVGIFWPAMGYMRGIYIPEQTRATIMNLCRVPLNGIVIGILMLDLQMKFIFQCCVVFLLLATVVQHLLYRCLLA